MNLVAATFRFDALGTAWELQTPEALSEALQSRLLARVAEFDATYSRFRPDSVVGRMAQAGGAYPFPAEAERLFDLYDQLYALTSGALDPLVGGDLERLGYDRTYSLTPQSGRRRSGENPSWARDVQREGPTLLIRRPLTLDFGAAGKGLLVDILGDLLFSAGHTDFLLDGSGDLRHAGRWGVDVGLEHPRHPQQVIGVTHLQNRALCASAINRRAWGKGLHHILNARTGEPAREVVATWVLADDALTADGLATALFLCHPAALVDAFSFSCVQLDAHDRAVPSPNFEGELFTTETILEAT